LSTFASGVDLVIFDQAIWHLSRFERPESTVRGLSNLFGDHFHPLIALFAPLYWIAADPVLLWRTRFSGGSSGPPTPTCTKLRSRPRWSPPRC
jgi:hypothetical protein